MCKKWNFSKSYANKIFKDMKNALNDKMPRAGLTNLRWFSFFRGFEVLFNQKVNFTSEIQKCTQ